MKDQQIQEFYEFASFRLDLKKRRLKHGEENISLTPKEFEILLMLVENAGRVVEKEDLLEKIWADTYVEEGTLTRNISWLRKKLAPYVAEDFRIIETLPKLGYRFLPEVRRSELLHQPESLTQNIEPSDDVSSILTPIASEKINDSALVSMPEVSPENAPIVLPKTPVSKIWILPVLLIGLLSAFILYQKASPKTSSELILASKIVPFSGLPGRETSPAFASDGKQIVYAWDGGIEGGNLNIYIKLLGAGEPVRLTSDPANEVNPVFSPDGKSIAFLRIYPSHNEIIMISALGGAERKIYDQASYASFSFSPDGKSLVLANLDLSQNQAGLFLLDLQSGEKSRLTTPDALAVDHTPRFSPDGKSLAFIRYFSSFHREIFVVPATGGEPRQITSDNTRIYGLAWNPDSRKLFFTSFRAVNQLNLWQIPLVGDNEPQLIPTGSKGLESLAISPDGRIIAFAEETADENIWEIDPNASSHPLIRSTRADHSQQFSPDGRQIVFASDRTGNYEIWLADADGKNQRQLTNSKSSAGSPRFSPDGKFIAYDSQNSGKSDIYVIPLNGGDSRRVTDGDKNNALPAWSADGQWIFFLSNRAGSDQIWKIPASGGDATQVTKQGAFEMFSAPDGKSIYYSKGIGKTGLWQVGTDSGEEKPIPALADAGSWRSWAVSSNGIYYTASATQPPYQIKFFDFATQQTKNVVSVEKSPLTYYANLSVSADGKKILYARQDQSADTIFLAEFEEAK